jgi:hypothetical protein
MKSIPEAFELTAAIEEIYFGTAQKNCFLATELRKEIGERRGRLQWLDFYNVKEAWNWGDEVDDDALDQAEEASERLSENLSMFLQAVFATDVFAVMTLEAHVNLIAQDKLLGATWEIFDRLSLDGKWLFLPAITGNPTFDPGAEPYQGLRRLIKRRNGLVHIKKRDRIVSVRGGESADEFLRSQIEQAESTLTLVRDLVSKLAQLTGSGVPAWSLGGPLHYYSLQARSVE